MTDQRNQNRRPPSERDRKAATGVADVERHERPAEDQNDRQPGGGRHSESEKPNSPDSRWGSGQEEGQQEENDR